MFNDRLPGPSLHAERREVEAENFLLLLALALFLAAQRDDLAHDLGIETRPLGLAVDILDVVGDGALFLFELFDSLDKGLEVAAVDRIAVHGRVFREFGVWTALWSAKRGGRDSPRRRSTAPRLIEACYGRAGAVKSTNAAIPT